MKKWIALFLISLIASLPIQAAEICRIWPDGQAEGLPDMVVTRASNAIGIDAYGKIVTHGNTVATTGSYAAGAMKADLTTTNAFAEFGVDLSAYRDGTYYLLLNDGTNTASGYISAAVPGGLTLDTEMVVNGTFTTATTSWAPLASVLSVDTNRLKILRDASVAPNGGYGGATQSIAVMTHGSYRWIATPTAGTGTAYARLDPASGGADAYLNANYTTAVAKYYMAKDATFVINLFVKDSSGTQFVYWDDVSLKRLTDCAATGAHIVSTKGGSTRAWYYQHASFNPNLAGTYTVYRMADLATIAGAPSYNNFKLQSLPASGYTNLHPYSYAVGSWGGRSRLNDTSPVLVADPAGGTFGFPFIPSADDNTHYATSGISGLIDSTVYCFSIFVRAGTPIPAQSDVFCRLTLRLKTTTLTDKSTYFNITDRTVGSAGTTYSGIDPTLYFGGGATWTRMWIAHNIDTGGTSPAVFVYVAEKDNDVNFVGDNTTPSFWVYGAQLNGGAYPLPLAVTNGAAVAVAGETKTIDISAATGATYPQILKLRDVLINTGTGDTDGISKGTMLVRIVPRFAFSLPSAVASFIKLNDTSSMLLISSTYDDYYVTDGSNLAHSNSSDADPVGDGTEFFIKAIWDSTVVTPTTGKLQLSESRNAGGTWLNGTAVDFDGVFTLNNTFYVGYSNEYPFDIGPIIFYDTPLTNDEATCELLKNGYSAGLLGP